MVKEHHLSALEIFHEIDELQEDIVSLFNECEQSKGKERWDNFFSMVFWHMVILKEKLILEAKRESNNFYCQIFKLMTMILLNCAIWTYSTFLYWLQTIDEVATRFVWLEIWVDVRDSDINLTLLPPYNTKKAAEWALLLSSGMNFKSNFKENLSTSKWTWTTRKWWWKFRTLNLTKRIYCQGSMQLV